MLTSVFIKLINVYLGKSMPIVKASNFFRGAI